MKELVVLSGKGGTGKTSISAALASIAPSKVLADCDVDAANFHLVAGGTIKQFCNFFSGFRPGVDQSLCSQCGKCSDICRFGAMKNGFIHSELDCEGCGVCVFNCPSHAISLHEKYSGRWLVSDTRLGLLVHAELGLAVENSGKLVSKVRREANSLAVRNNKPLIITDGPPGIGCPAIATLTGASLALAVVEPSLSSIHDLERLTTLVKHFKLPLAACINKATLNMENRQAIINWCNLQGIEIVGEFPYSDTFYKAVRSGKTIYEMGEDELKSQVVKLWRNVQYLLQKR